MTDDEEFEKMAEQMIKTFGSTVCSMPSAYTQMLLAIDFIFGDTVDIVIVGEKEAQDTKEMKNQIQSSFIPNKILLFHSKEQKIPEAKFLESHFENRTSIDNKATVYVCKNQTCQKPTTDVFELIEQIK